MLKNVDSNTEQSTNEQTLVTQVTWFYLTVNQFCDEYPAFKKGGVRSLIFNAHENGLAESGAIVRVGRKILIHCPSWFAWVQ